MKSSRRCPKCDSTRIGRFDFVPDTYLPGPHVYLSQFAAVTRDRKAIERGVGELEAYVCGACGLYELYVKDVASLREDAIAGFRWLGPDAPGSR